MYTYLSTLSEEIARFTPRLLAAALLIYVGFKLTTRLAAPLGRLFTRVGFDAAMRTFLSSLCDLGIKALVLLAAAGLVGFDLAALVGIIAGAAFAVGLALQGSLSNFAAGVVILIFKPYQVGDWIEVQDKFGKVEEIQIFNTLVATPGYKTLIIPNAQVIDGVVTNLSRKGRIRLELTVSMPYEEDFDKVQRAILDALGGVPQVMTAPPPEVGIEAYESHSILLAVRPWVRPDDYWDAVFAANRQIKGALHDAGIKVAYSEGVELGPIGR